MKGKLMVVYIPELEPHHRDAIRDAAQKKGYEVHFFEKEQEALREAEKAEILFTQSATLPQHAPELRWMCTPSAGVNTFLSLEVFRSGQAMLTNSSGAYGVTIAEHVIMITLEMLRRQIEYNEIIAKREWIRGLPVKSIKGSRVMVLGTGDLGQETARRLRAFEPESLIGMNRSCRNPETLFDEILAEPELDQRLSETDILIITLPDTPDTVHMLNARRLALLPDESLIVNVGRGSVIDQKALERELRSGRLRAALDVFETEPIPPEDSLWTCPNVLLAPHVAGNMSLPYTRDRITSLFLEDFENYCAGKPLVRRIDCTRGY